MTIDIFTQMIGDLGFPISVATVIMVGGGKVLSKLLSEVLAMFGEKLDNIADALRENTEEQKELKRVVEKSNRDQSKGMQQMRELILVSMKGKE